jgi:hypothetical protein
MLGYESTLGHVNTSKALCKVRSFARKVALNQTGCDQDFEIGEFHVFRPPILAFSVMTLYSPVVGRGEAYRIYIRYIQLAD